MALVYWSEAAVVWIRREDHPALARRSYRIVTPVAPVASLGRALQAAGTDRARLGQVHRELSQLAKDDPTGLRALILVTLFFDHLGPTFRRQRDESLERLEENWGEHPSTAEVRERLLGRRER